MLKDKGFLLLAGSHEFARLVRYRALFVPIVEIGTSTGQE